MQNRKLNKLLIKRLKVMEMMKLFNAEPRKRGRKLGTKNPEKIKELTKHEIANRAAAQLVARIKKQDENKREFNIKKILLRMKLQETWFNQGIGESWFQGNLFITEFPGVHSRRIVILKN